MARPRKRKNKNRKSSTAGSKKGIRVSNEMLTFKEEPDVSVCYIKNSNDPNPLGDVNDYPPTVSVENGIKQEIKVTFEESTKDVLDLKSKPKTRCYKKSSLYCALNSYKKYYIPKKLMKEKTLNLEAILRLTEKPMIALFSQMSSNEITKNYAYTCCLVPTECAISFSSFGNEGKARSQMYEHLLSHLTELLNKKKADPTFVFKADVVKKNSSLGESMSENNLSASGKKQGKRTKVNKENGRTFRTINTSDNDNVVENDIDSNVLQMSEIKLEKLDSDESLKIDVINNDEDFLGFHNELLTDEDGTDENLVRKRKNPDDDCEWNSKLSASKKKSPVNATKHVIPKNTHQKSKNTINNKSINIQKIKSANILKNSRHQPPILSKKTEVSPEVAVHKKFVESQDKHICSIKDHPWCTDHCYDYKHRSSNKDKAVNECQESKDHVYDSIKEEEEDAPLHRITFPLEDNFNQLKLILPIIKVSLNELPYHLGCLPNDVFEACPDADDVELPSIRPCKPPPTLLSGPLPNGMNNTGILATRYTEAFQTVMTKDISKEEVERLESQTTPLSDLEIRRLAMYYTDELRNKKREDSEITLTCKICKTKQFTATSTLLHHYKSHAGIKPYICKLCKATFTRQHSLNYHNLIHKNLNRFKCEDCGRMFRHPSHFKEHCRKHTGETPFHCTDCPLKFKTRNTYKRHMRTRHNKSVASFFTTKTNDLIKRNVISINKLHHNNNNNNNNNNDRMNTNLINKGNININRTIINGKLVDNGNFNSTSSSEQAVKNLLFNTNKVIVIAPENNPEPSTPSTSNTLNFDSNDVIFVKEEPVDKDYVDYKFPKILPAPAGLNINPLLTRHKITFSSKLIPKVKEGNGNYVATAPAVTSRTDVTTSPPAVYIISAASSSPSVSTTSLLVASTLPSVASTLPSAVYILPSVSSTSSSVATTSIIHSASSSSSASLTQSTMLAKIMPRPRVTILPPPASLPRRGPIILSKRCFPRIPEPIIIEPDC